jgi:tol-pal system protein YbgF
MRTILYGFIVAVFAALAAVTLSAAPSSAQTGDSRGLVTKLQQLERDLITLQRYVYAGWKAPAGADAPAAAQAAGISPGQISRVQVRLAELETEIRNLTGQIEEMGFKIDTAQRRLDKLVEDVDFRLTALEADVARSREMAAVQPGPEAVPALADEPEAALAGATAEEEPGPAAGSNTLGTISAADRAAVGQGAAAAEPATLLPQGTPQERYNFAIRLLRQGDWGEAETAFQEFVGAHPDDGLAANAQYWLGETFYVRQDFDNAAAAFLEAYQKYPESAKAPDSLLKLGMSLSGLGLAQEACQTFTAVVEKHADAPASILRLVEKERLRAGCS